MSNSPRFQSDCEGETKQEKDDKQYVKKALDKAENWGSSGVDVDKRMLDGRKANRGFTISVGGATHVEEEAVSGPNGRSDKRAQTLPAMSTRRADTVLSSETQAKLTKEQENLVSRRRRGSAAMSYPVVPEAVMEKIWKEETTCHVHGIMTEGQSHGDERERKFFVSEALPGGDSAPTIACQKGSKGLRDTTPNQDNFSLTYFKNGWTLACAFDGHGPFGHLVSTRTVQTVPYYLAVSEKFPSNMKEALIEAFETAQRDVVVNAVDDGWDVQASGSTAVACCWKGDEIWTANAGDSRCVVGTEAEKLLLYETEDHKPDTAAEKKRIEESGGEVRTQVYPDGWVNHRIFVKGEDYPGLCMARSFGDESVKAHGVIATPQVESYKVDLSKDPFIIIASDGVWEFLGSEFVVKAVAKKIKTDGPVRTVQKLQREARKRWKQEEGDYCDDITSVLIQLRQ